MDERTDNRRLKMNEKINWNDLKKSTAERCNSPETEVELFMNALAEAIREEIIHGNDHSVRINGLGTFSVKTMAARKSVNINTGEDIIISEYNKVSFQPENAIKDVLAHLSPNTGSEKAEESKEKAEGSREQIEEAEDPIRKIGEQATEILDILAEIASMNEGETGEDSGTSDTSDTSGTSETSETSETSKTSETSETSETNCDEAEDEGKSKGWKIGSIIVLVVAVLAVAGYLAWGYWREQQPTAEPTPEHRSPVMEYTEPVTDEENVLEVDTTEVTAEPAAAEESSEDSMVPEGNPARDYSRTMTTVPLTNGSRLTLLAERYFGNKDLWVFIYEANRDKLPSPHRISVGTEIRIPELDACWKDTTNAETKAELARLKEMYEAMR